MGQNADAIIPSYYQLHKDPTKLFTINFFEIIKDDIRNLRHLNSYQMKYIKNLSHDHKYELIQLFNECINTVSTLLEK
jgi:hypothetical protein